MARDRINALTGGGECIIESKAYAIPSRCINNSIHLCNSHAHLHTCTPAVEPLNLMNFFSGEIRVYSYFDPNSIRADQVRAMRCGLLCNARRHSSSELWIVDQFLLLSNVHSHNISPHVSSVCLSQSTLFASGFFQWENGNCIEWKLFQKSRSMCLTITSMTHRQGSCGEHGCCLHTARVIVSSKTGVSCLGRCAVVRH